ncbi:MAG: response regulator transcription factor [Gammaproteobacteria bacterium]|nr:response regulator transcription factor [Gammaproteobacteria bacterium]
MKILIVDDEPLARSRLRALLDELGGYSVAAEAGEGREALNLTQSCKPEVVLLDIGMPGINGMEIAKRLAESAAPPVVIFTTAYEEYALEAFEKQAVDYLLKPIRKERLKQALERARALYTAPPAPPHKETARTHISTLIAGSLRLVPVSQIYYFSAEQKYTMLHWPQGEALLEESLTKLEKEFAGQFIRIHRSALAALVHIAGLEKSKDGRHYIHFRDIDNKLEVSRRHIPLVKEILADMRGGR